MRRVTSGNSIWGVVLVFLGVGFLLETTSSAHFGNFVANYWPVVLLIVALFKLIEGRVRSATFWGLLGLILLLATLGVFKVGFWSVFWPAVLILVGLNLLFHAGSFAVTGDSNSNLNLIAGFGSVHKVAASKNFQEANMVSFFGGSKLDLKSAKLSKNGAEINVVSLFGGTEIIVPDNVPVKVDVVALFGGSEDKRQHPSVEIEEPYLTIQGFVIFGGVEIKS